MSTMPLVKVPRTAKKGEAVLLRAKIRHPMETGWRKNAAGETVPRKRINRFTCTFEGREVIDADFHSGVSADPYLAFFARASKTGTFHFKWFEDGGGIFERTAALEVIE